MSLTYNGTAIKKAYYNGTKLQTIYYNGVKVWSGASNVTYIYAGKSESAEVEEGSNAASKTVSISGATFLGWTTTKGSTTVMSNIPATGEPMTLYAIYKYDDVHVPNSIGYRDDSYGGPWDGEHYTKWNDYSGYVQPPHEVYCYWYRFYLTSGTYKASMYKAVKVSLRGTITINFKDDIWNMYLKCGSGSTLFAQPWTSSEQHPATFDSEFTANIGINDGDVRPYIYSDNGSGNGWGVLYIHDIYLIGRTVCS